MTKPLPIFSPEAKVLYAAYGGVVLSVYGWTALGYYVACIFFYHPLSMLWWRSDAHNWPHPWGTWRR